MVSFSKSSQEGSSRTAVEEPTGRVDMKKCRGWSTCSAPIVMLAVLSPTMSCGMRSFANRDDRVRRSLNGTSSWHPNRCGAESDATLRRQQCAVVHKDAKRISQVYLDVVAGKINESRCPDDYLELIEKYTNHDGKGNNPHNYSTSRAFNELVEYYTKKIRKARQSRRKRNHSSGCPLPEVDGKVHEQSPKAQKRVHRKSLPQTTGKTVGTGTGSVHGQTRKAKRKAQSESLFQNTGPLSKRVQGWRPRNNKSDTGNGGIDWSTGIPLLGYSSRINAAAARRRRLMAEHKRALMS